MIGQRWHVYPTSSKSALRARHAPGGTVVEGREAECWLCARGACEQRIEDGYPDVVVHGISPNMAC